MNQEYFVEAGESAIRIDRYLSERNQDISRSYLQKLLKDEKVLVDGKPVKSNYKVSAGDKSS